MKNQHIKREIHECLITVGLAGFELAEYVLQPQHKRLLDVVDAIPDGFIPPKLMVGETHGSLDHIGLFWDTPLVYVDIEFTPEGVSVFIKNHLTRYEAFHEMHYLTTAWFNEYLSLLREVST